MRQTVMRAVLCLALLMSASAQAGSNAWIRQYLYGNQGHSPPECKNAMWRDYLSKVGSSCFGITRDTQDPGVIVDVRGGLNYPPVPFPGSKQPRPVHD